MKHSLLYYNRPLEWVLLTQTPGDAHQSHKLRGRLRIFGCELRNGNIGLIVKSHVHQQDQQQGANYFKNYSHLL